MDEATRKRDTRKINSNDVVVELVVIKWVKKDKCIDKENQTRKFREVN